MIGGDKIPPDQPAKPNQWASNMLHEKSPGSVWNVAAVAIVVLLAVMAVSGLVPGGDAATMASAL